MIAAVYARVLLATLGLLALATSASAECAWVLWAEYDFNNRITAPAPQEGFSTKAECSQAAKDRFKDASKRGTRVVFSCLPDTVDPRGPKGK